MTIRRLSFFLVLLGLLTVGLMGLGRKQMMTGSPAVPSSAPVSAVPVNQAPDRTDALLTLVNAAHPLPDHWQPDLTMVENGHQVDRRCAAALEAMLADCRAAGLSPVVCSSYRSPEKQAALYNNLVEKLCRRGSSPAQAAQDAAGEVAVPGTSEHQLGLAVDIVDASYQLLDHDQAHTAVQQWLLEHCWEYGFILRYPTDKQAVTGIIYEPWHYRYVGRDHAKAIQAAGLCLEEYLR